MLRIYLFLLFFIPVAACAQKLPPPPPPPPPPPVPKDVNNGAGVNGIQLLTIPVVGNFKLGMLRKDYDSISKKETPAIVAVGTTYNFKPSAQFIGRRISSLELNLTGVDDPNAHTAIVHYFEERLGDPDSRSTENHKEKFPTASDSTLTGEYGVTETKLLWNLNKYDVSVYSKLIETSKGVWKTKFVIRYSGDSSFRDLLGFLEAKEQY